MRQFILLTSAAILPSLVFALPLGVNWNANGTGCVDPTGYLSCYTEAETFSDQCTVLCGGNRDCISGCYGNKLAAHIGCWVQSCWNQVYSCEYQLTAIDYYTGTGAAQGQVPFFPAPPATNDNGACSCSLGYVYTNMTSTVAGNTCSNVTLSTGGDLPSVDNCLCCQFSIPLSKTLNICPKSDLSVLGISADITNVQSILTNSISDPSIADETSNCAILNNASDSCGNDYNFGFLGSQVYNPLSLPSDILGTEPLSNMGGNAFTEPSTTLFTLSLEPAYSVAITQVPFVAGAGAETDTAAATAAATASTTSGAVKASVTSSATKGKGNPGATSTSSGSAAATATSKSGCERTKSRSLLVSGLLVFVASFVMA